MSHIFSLKGKALKLDTWDDMEKHLKGVDASTITEIHLEGNTIGVDASEALAKWMAGAKNLKVANFADIYTGRLISEIPHSLKAICDALIDKTSLVEVNLSDNAFGGRSVDPMVPFITQNRSFQIFKLNNNGLGPAGGTVIANALRDSARLSKEAGVKSNLRTVICGRNRLEDGSSEAWADAFAEHGTLEEVRMVQNGIWRTGITNLVRGLAKNPNLKHIDLQDNTFTTGGILDGVDEWAKALPSWPELHTLNLSDCILSTEGEVPALLTAIIEGSNPNLKTLIIQNNNLETQTFEALADAMPKALKNLMRLEVQYNDQEEDDEHIERLYDTMKQRGGRLIATDEDEEEDEAEQEVKAAAPVVAAALSEKDKEPKTVDDSADALADALSKVKISGP